MAWRGSRRPLADRRPSDPGDGFLRKRRATGGGNDDPRLGHAAAQAAALGPERAVGPRRRAAVAALRLATMAPASCGQCPAWHAVRGVIRWASQKDDLESPRSAKRNAPPWRTGSQDAIPSGRTRKAGSIAAAVRRGGGVARRQ